MRHLRAGCCTSRPVSRELRLHAICHTHVTRDEQMERGGAEELSSRPRPAASHMHAAKSSCYLLLTSGGLRVGTKLGTSCSSCTLLALLPERHPHEQRFCLQWEGSGLNQTLAWLCLTWHSDSNFATQMGAVFEQGTSLIHSRGYYLRILDGVEWTFCHLQTALRHGD